MLFVITFLTSFSAFSAISGHTTPVLPPTVIKMNEQFAGKQQKEIPFFKSKRSIFPSGYAAINKLNEKILVSEASEAFYLERDKKKISPTLVPHITAFHLSRIWIEKYTRRRVKPQPQKDLTEVLLNYETDPSDKGLVFNLREVKLKQEASATSLSLAVVPEFNYFIPISYEKGFVKVMYNKKFGYIDINDCISKFDFAKFAYSVKSETQNWEVVHHREFDHLITENRKLIPLNHIQGLIVDERLSYIFKTNKDYPVWTSFKINKEQAEPWQQSLLKGHGAVWWKKPFKESVVTKYISIDELLKKTISSVSFSDDDNKKGIASANGVYITYDGQNWTEIEQFKGYSGPVHYFNDSLIFVGNYRSTNGGRDFDQYIQIDKISKAVETYLGKQPKRLQISRIKVQKPYTVVVDVKTETKTVRLKTPLFAQDWKPFKR